MTRPRFPSSSARTRRRATGERRDDGRARARPLGQADVPETYLPLRAGGVKFWPNYLIPFLDPTRSSGWRLPSRGAVASGQRRFHRSREYANDWRPARAPRGSARIVISRCASETHRFSRGRRAKTHRAAQIIVDEGMAYPILLAARDHRGIAGEAGYAGLHRDRGPATPRR